MWWLVLALWFVCLQETHAASYYVSNSGNDSNSGTSAGLPWLTVAKVNGSAFSAGDTVYFQRGGVWRETLIVPSSGTASAMVTIDSYGSGELPKFVGSDIVSAGSFSEDSGLSYSVSFSLIATGVMMVWEDGTRLTAASSQAEVQSTPGRFFRNAGTTYISSTDGSDPRVNGKVYEVPGRVRLIYTNGKSFVKIRYVETLRSSGDDTTYGNVEISGSDNIVEYITSHDARRHCLQIYSEAGISSNRNIIRNNTLYDTWVSFVVSVFHQNVATVTSAHNQIIDNLIYNAASNTTGELLTVHGSDATHQVLGTSIQGNTFLNSASTSQAIEFYDVAGLSFNGNYMDGVFNSNLIYIRLRGSDVAIQSNFFNLGSVISTADGVFVQDLVGVAVANNIFYGLNGRHAIRFFTNATSGRVVNNIFHTTSKTVRVDTTAQSGFISDANIAYNIGLASQWGMWGATEYTFANWKSASSQDANTLTTDPLLTSLNTAAFTSSNFHLMAASPGLGGGRWWGNACKDARGRPCFPGQIDIGAYQKSSGDPATTRAARQ